MIRDIALLHGGGQGSWVWDETIAAMREQAGESCGRIVALDVPGCGAKRGRDTTGLGIEAVIAELADDLDRLDLRDALLVGHSQGGTVLPGLVAARPHRIAAAVYFSCCAPLEGQTVGAMMGRGARGGAEQEVGWPIDPASDTREALFAAAFCNDMDDAATRAFLARLGQDAWPQATALENTQWRYDTVRDLPSTYVVALRDNILTPPWQDRFAARLHAKRRVHIDAGHQAMNTRPHALAEILLAEAAAPAANREGL